ncbi:hypothetical protein RRSWK_05489 [Rhodopirellula sp. SWK7]|nr:hypothetical protein RRSWK_05489 [Rhodopirellula sp. SWK7]
MQTYRAGIYPVFTLGVAKFVASSGGDGRPHVGLRRRAGAPCGAACFIAIEGLTR